MNSGFHSGVTAAARCAARSSRARGFTLIEVSLAILVVGLSLAVVFGLFPAGLRANEEGVAETRAAMFGDYLLNGMRANAAAINNWTDWANINPDDSENLLLNNPAGPFPVTTVLSPPVSALAPTVVTLPHWPTPQDPALQYKLTLRKVELSEAGKHTLSLAGSAWDFTRIGYSALLEVQNLGDYWPTNQPVDGVFYTEFLFGGM